MQFITSRESKKEKVNKKIMNVMVWICPFISCTVVFSILMKALNYDVNIPIIAMFIISSIEIVVGNYLPKCRQNSVVGIRIPWTMKSEYNWNRTHRFAGNVYFSIGVVTLILTFFINNIAALLIINIILLLSPIAYSFKIRNSLKNA